MGALWEWLKWAWEKTKDVAEAYAPFMIPGYWQIKSGAAWNLLWLPNPANIQQTLQEQKPWWFFQNIWKKIEEFVDPIKDMYQTWDTTNTVTKQFIQDNTNPDNKGILSPYLNTVRWPKGPGMVPEVNPVRWSSPLPSGESELKWYDKSNWDVLNRIVSYYDDIKAHPEYDQQAKESKELVMRDLSEKLPTKPKWEDLGAISQTLKWLYGDGKIGEWYLQKALVEKWLAPRTQEEADAVQAAYAKSLKWENTEEVASTIYHWADRENTKGKRYQWKKLTATEYDNAQISNKIASQKDVQYVTSRPKEWLALAEAELLKHPDSQVLKDYVQKFKNIIADNEKELYPYLIYIASNMWANWNNITQLTKSYERETGKDVHEVRGYEYWRHANRWDKADRLIGELNASTLLEADIPGIGKVGIPWTNLPDAVWLVGKAANRLVHSIFTAPEQMAQTFWWAQFAGADIRTFKNLDRDLADGKYFGSLWKDLKAVNNTIFNMAPEVIVQWYGMKWASKLWDLAEASVLLKRWQVGMNALNIEKATLWLVNWENKLRFFKKGMQTIDEVAEQAAKLTAEWKSAIPVIEWLSKSNYFAYKTITKLPRWLLNNYWISSWMQANNPDKYSWNDFALDTVFGFVDVVFDLWKALNKFHVDDITAQNMMRNAFIKQFHDIPNVKWQSLTPDTKNAFNEQAQVLIAKYNQLIEDQNPQVIADYVNELKATRDDIITTRDKLQIQYDLDPQRTLNFARWQQHDIIPKEMSETQRAEIWNMDPRPDKFIERLDEVSSIKRELIKEWNGSPEEIQSAIDDFIGVEKQSITAEIPKWTIVPVDKRVISKEDARSVMKDKWLILITTPETQWTIEELYQYNFFGPVGWKKRVVWEEREIGAWYFRKTGNAKSETTAHWYTYYLTKPDEEFYKKGTSVRDIRIRNKATKVELTPDEIISRRILILESPYGRRVSEKNGVITSTISWITQPNAKNIQEIKRFNPGMTLDIAESKAWHVGAIGTAADIDEHALLKAEEIAPPLRWVTPPKKVYDGDRLVSYGWLQVKEIEPLKNLRGDPVAARLIRSPDGNTILMSPENMRKKFEEKAWTKTQTPWVAAFPEDKFKTYEEREDYVLAHEYAHHTEPAIVKQVTTTPEPLVKPTIKEKPIVMMQDDRESLGKYVAEEKKTLNWLLDDYHKFMNAHRVEDETWYGKWAITKQDIKDYNNEMFKKYNISQDYPKVKFDLGRKKIPAILEDDEWTEFMVQYQDLERELYAKAYKELSPSFRDKTFIDLFIKKNWLPNPNIDEPYWPVNDLWARYLEKHPGWKKRKVTETIQEVTTISEPIVTKESAPMIMKEIKASDEYNVWDETLAQYEDRINNVALARLDSYIPKTSVEIIDDMIRDVKKYPKEYEWTEVIYKPLGNGRLAAHDSQRNIIRVDPINIHNMRIDAGEQITVKWINPVTKKIFNNEKEFIEFNLKRERARIVNPKTALENADIYEHRLTNIALGKETKLTWIGVPGANDATNSMLQQSNKVIGTLPWWYDNAIIQQYGNEVINSSRYTPFDSVYIDGPFTPESERLLNIAIDSDVPRINTQSGKVRKMREGLGDPDQEKIAQLLRDRWYADQNGNGSRVKQPPEIIKETQGIMEDVENLAKTNTEHEEVIDNLIEKHRDRWMQSANNIVYDTKELNEAERKYRSVTAKYQDPKTGEPLWMNLEWSKSRKGELYAFANDVIDTLPNDKQYMKDMARNKLDNIDPKKWPTVINLVKHWGLVDFIRYVDPLSYWKMVGEAEDAVYFWEQMLSQKAFYQSQLDFTNAFWHTQFEPAVFDKFQTVLKNLWWSDPESKVMKGVKKYIGMEFSIPLYRTEEGKLIKFKWWNSDWYKFWQTVMNLQGQPKMLVMNMMGIGSDEMIKYNLVWWDMRELWDLRQRYGILFSQWDISIEGRAIRDRITSMWKKIKEWYDMGLYNIWDSLMKDTLVNEAVWQAIEEVTYHTSYDAFRKEIDLLPLNKRLDVLKDISERADNLLKARTWFYHENWRSQIVFGWSLADAKRVGYWMRSLMAWWWVGISKAWLRIVWEWMPQLFSKEWLFFPNKTKNKYLEMLVDPKYGKAGADKYIREFYMKNEDMLHLFERIKSALVLWQRVSRSMQKDDGSDATTLDVLKMGMNFSYPLQALQSMPRGREAIAFFSQLFAETGHEEWRFPTKEDAEKAGIAAVEQLLKDLGRRFILARSVASSLWKMNAKWESFTNILNPLGENGILKSRQEATAGYLYYSAQEVTKEWYDLYQPKNSNAWLMDILPYSDPIIDEARDIKKQLDYNNLISDPDTYAWKRWMFHIPMIKERNFAGMADDARKGELTAALWQDDAYNQELLKWKIPRDKMWEDGWVYAFNILTQFSPNGQTKFFDDLRKKMWWTDKVTWEQWTNPALQNQEDLFVYNAMATLNSWNYDGFMKMFREAKNNYAKSAVELLMFAETKSPWAGRELLSAIVSNEAYLARKAMGNAKLWETDPDMDKQIRKQIWEYYGDFLYVVDKPTGYTNILKYYIKNNYPDFSKYMSDPNNVNGEPSKAINFIRNKKAVNKEGEEYNPVNFSYNQMFQLDALARMAVADPKIWMDWIKIKNIYASIVQPTKLDLASPTYVKNLLIASNRAMDTMRKTSTNQESSLQMVTWLLSWLLPVLGKVLKEHPEFPKQIGKERDDSMNFLFGTTKGITELWKDVATKSYRENQFWYKWTSGYTNKYPTTFRLNNILYNQLKDMAYAFNYFKNYNGSYPSYKSSYYNSTDRDILTARGKALNAVGKWRYAPERWAGFKQPKDPEGRTPVQKWGSARPFTKLEDPDKPTDRESVTSFKRAMKRRAIKFDIGSTRKRLTKWWLYKSSYQGGNRKRRVSRSKGWDSKGSKQHK